METAGVQAGDVAGETDGMRRALERMIGERTAYVQKQRTLAGNVGRYRA